MGIRPLTALMFLCLSTGLQAQDAPPIRWIAGGHSDAILSVAYSADGKFAASGSRDGTAKIWQVSTGKLVRTLTAAAGSTVRAVAFSPDSKTLAVGEAANIAGLVETWSVATGTPVASWQSPIVQVSALAYAPNGALLAIAATDGNIRIVNARNGTPLRTLVGHSDEVDSLGFSPNSVLLASGSRDRSVKLWNASNGSLLTTLHHHTDRVTSVGFSPDGKWLATGGDDTRVDLWNVGAGTLQASLSGNVAGVVGVLFSPDSKTILSGAEDGSIRSWLTATGVSAGQNNVDNVPIQAIALAPDGSKLLTASITGALSLRQSATGAVTLRLAQQAGTVGSLVFSNDDTLLAAGASPRYTGDGRFRLWRPVDGVRLAETPASADNPVVLGFVSGNAMIAVEAVSATPFTPPQLAVVSRYTGSLLRSFSSSTGTPGSVGISSDGKRLVAAEYGHTPDGMFTTVLAIDVWDVATGALVHTIKAKGLAPQFATDGNIAVLSSTVNGNLIINIWRVSDGKLLNSFPTTFSIYGLGVFPDDSAFAMQNEAGVALFKISDGSGQLAATPTGFGISRIAFTRDGSVIATASSFATGIAPILAISRVSDAKTLATYTVELGTGIEKLAFSPDGSALAVGRVDGTLFVMNNPGYIPPGITKFETAQSVLRGGLATTIQVTLAGLAPIDGATVQLTSSDATVVVPPPTLMVLATRTTATMHIVTRSVTAKKQITLTASYGGTKKTIPLTILR